MKKNYIFLPMLLFVILQDNNQIFASLEFTNFNNLSLQDQKLSNNSYIGDVNDFLIIPTTSNKLSTSPAVLSSNNQPSPYSWTVTGETSEQKQKRLNSMVQEVDNKVNKLLQNGKILPIDIYNWLQSENFTKSDIDEMNAHLLNSKKTTLNNKIKNYYIQRIVTTKNAINSSPAALSSSSNSQFNVNKTSAQPSTTLITNEQKEYIIQRNITFLIFPALMSYFTQRAKEDAENVFNKKHQKPISHYSDHLPKFDLSSTSAKGVANLSPIGKNINNVIKFEDYTSPSAKNKIKEYLKGKDIERVYNHTFAGQLRWLSETQCQQPSENKNKTSYHQQRIAWINDQHAMKPQSQSEPQPQEQEQ